MKLFKYNPQSYAEELVDGEFLNGMTSITWIERFRDPGEFTIEAPLSSGLRDTIPEGTILAQVDSDELMIVENHQVSEDQLVDPTVKITGRTFDSFLENRIVGMNGARSGDTLVEYAMSAQATWLQAVDIINDHIRDAVDSNDDLNNFEAITHGFGFFPPGTIEDRTINRGSLLQAVLDILAIDDGGIRTVRKSAWASAVGGSDSISRFVIYKGNHREDKVRFSWSSGDLKTASYLFSSKTKKNSALILGRYVWETWDGTPVTADNSSYNRRIMIVDASDLDGDLTAAPTGGALTTLLTKMRARGRQALAKQKQITITQTDVADFTRYQFRKDYDIGDFVTLEGDFGQRTVMRVVEYAEIEDENGVSGHPTLSIPGA